jgi:Zn-finger nucleic acid-binding protein
MKTSQPEALNCPNCGAAVSSDRTQCEFCRSRLKTVGCPSCLGLMFLGSKFCGHCGAEAANVRAFDLENPGKCPRCSVELNGAEIGGISMRECERCGGFWSDARTFERICSDKDKQSAVLTFIGNKPSVSEPLSKISYVPCPDCGQLMNRSNFARSSGVIIDLCKQHGVWFDAEELPKILDFINGGGLARAREKEKIAIMDERTRLIDEQRRTALIERRSGTAGFHDDDKESGFGGFIAALFDI